MSAQDKSYNLPLLLFLGFVLVISIFLSIYNENYYFALVSFPLIVGIIGLFDFRLLYYLLIFCIPFSIQFEVGSMSIDLFSEPIMIGLLFISIVIFIKNKSFDLRFLNHPLSLLLLIHFFWMIFVSFYSINPLHSVKYLISKAWYIGAFFFMTGIIVQNINDFKRIFWLYFSSLFLIIILTLIRHSSMGMTFESASYPMTPFFQNHVLYSSTLVIFFPFVWFAWKCYTENQFKYSLLTLALLFFIVAIGFSYTRASWLALATIPILFFIIKKNFTKYVLIISGLFIVTSITFLVNDHKFMDMASDYHKTIFHKGDIEGHLKATYTLEDVSGMERVHRWVAAGRMFSERPMLGTGPSTFYPEYKRYTLMAFHTYVSNNPEKSSTHNYFLLTLCEQGIIGFLLFTAICISVILIGTRLYSTLKSSEYKNLTMACLLSLILLYLHLMFNDLIETDKMGSLFFISLILIIKIDIWAKDAKLSGKEV
jgi:O-antigen ligase